MTPVTIAIVSTVGGVLLKVLVDTINGHVRFKKELRELNYVNVTGKDWFAAWQTSVDNTLLINTERLAMRQRGNTVRVLNMERSPENPKGGYLWQAQLLFSQGRYLMGCYFALKGENNPSRGALFLCHQAPKRTLYGRWVGAAYDGDLANGFVVISKSRENSRAELEKLIQAHPDDVNIIVSAVETRRGADAH